VLQTDRIELRRPVEADRAVFEHLFGDDDFMVFSGGALEFGWRIVPESRVPWLRLWDGSRHGAARSRCGVV
jgi:hypothetical protein